jgi:cobalamin biosynthesis protein CobT
MMTRKMIQKMTTKRIYSTGKLLRQKIGKGSSSRSYHNSLFFLANYLARLNGMDHEEDTSDEEENGGPSDPEKAKKAKTSDIVKAIAEADAAEDGEDEDDDEEMSEDDAKAAATLKKIMKGKGKAKDDNDEDEEEDLDEDDDLEMEETIVCTLDPEKVRATLLRIQSAFRKYWNNPLVQLAHIAHY